MKFVDQHDLARSGKNLISRVDPFEKLNLSQTDRKDYQGLTERQIAPNFSLKLQLDHKNLISGLRTTRVENCNSTSLF